MKAIKNFLFSMQLTGVLLLLFAFVIGYATFIENDYGTQSAKALIYNSRWFEILLLLLVVNLSGSIFKYRMYVRSKWPILLFHVSFVVIFIGAALTRYVGFEGMMSIREGDASGRMVSDKTYVTVRASDGTNTETLEEKVLFSPVTRNRFRESFSLGERKITIENLRYIPSAAESAVEAVDGKPIVSLVVSDSVSGMTTFLLRKGEEKRFGKYLFTFGEQAGPSGITILLIDNELYFSSTDSVSSMVRMGGAAEKLAPDTLHLFRERALYRLPAISFVLKKFYASGKTSLMTASPGEGQRASDAILALVTVDGMAKEVPVFGGKGYVSPPAMVQFPGISLEIRYGSKWIELPFMLKLRDFQLERYPGSHSPSSFASEVTVIDEERNLEMPYRIYMNNVLNYRGYRFFQSSYDPDEKGTVLSVNHDRWGTIITYLGYLILTVGMIVTLFIPKSRFRSLSLYIDRLRKTRKSTLILLFLMSGAVLQGYSQVENSRTARDGISSEHAEKFGRLLIQDRDGRIKPLNTLASEVVRKVTRKADFMGLTPEQVFLGMMSDPAGWQETPMIKISNPQLKDFLGIEGKYAAFTDLVSRSAQGNYLIAEFVENAYQKKPALRNKFDTEVMKVDERVNICYMVYLGSFLNIFPVPGDENNKWVTAEKAEELFEGEEALFVKGIFSMYLDEVKKAKATGDWTAADEHLDYIRSFQEKYGSRIIPSESRIRMEILYNNYNLFNKLSRYFGLFGLILLIFHFIRILAPRYRLKWPIVIVNAIIILLFVVHTAGLALRWYISGHAPWSNGYESMIYIAWATVLSGILFMRRSQITLSVSALLASVILMVAGLSWMDPEITNLVPVLKSYWLIIHVAVITGSYGFLALGALLGAFNLILMNFRTGKNAIRLNLTLSEITHIIEMTLTIGLFLLTIGTFLGGVWANESWGRYWGWDPKETWALVTILVYAFILHMRFIPGFRGNFPVSSMALIGFGSVLMTYFGVNYYLSGLHSYAQGDPVPVPTFVYYTVGIVILLSILAFVSERKFGKSVTQVDQPEGNPDRDHKD